MSRPRSLALHHYALLAVGAVILLNLLVRGLFKIGGIPATLLVAIAVALALRWLLQRQAEPPARGARIALVLLYGGILGLLYLGLWGLMWLKDEPGHMGQLIFVLHYLSYPLILALALLPGRRPG